MENGLVEVGVHVLQNKEVKIKKDGNWIVLVGIDDPEIVSRGIGNGIIPIRISSWPEVVVVKLRK